MTARRSTLAFGVLPVLNGVLAHADPRGLNLAARERLIATLPSCALITAGIHANAALERMAREDSPAGEKGSRS